MKFRSTAIALVLCCMGPSGVHAQAPSVLTGLNYKGTSEATFQEGCEGCGNPGHVEFNGTNSAEFTLPGSDIIGSLHYSRKGNLLRISESVRTMELNGDTLFFTAYNYRHVYLRVRKD